jgi:hypothetical protein
MLKEKVKIPPYDTIPKNSLLMEELEKLMDARIFLLDEISKAKKIDRKMEEDKKFKILESSLNNSEDIIGWINNGESDLVSFYFICLAFCKQETERNL